MKQGSVCLVWAWGTQGDQGRVAAVASWSGLNFPLQPCLQTPTPLPMDHAILLPSSQNAPPFAHFPVFAHTLPFAHHAHPLAPWMTVVCPQDSGEPHLL